MNKFTEKSGSHRDSVMSLGMEFELFCLTRSFKDSKLLLRLTVVLGIDVNFETSL